MSRAVRCMLSFVACGLLGCEASRDLRPGGEAAILRLAAPHGSADVGRGECHAALESYLESALHRDVEWVTTDGTDALMDAFDRGEVDFAWMGGWDFVRAERAHGVEPLVLMAPDWRFTTDFIVPEGSQRLSIGANRGGRLAFGPRLSTSGHVMPHDHLLESGFEVERHFASVRHARSPEEVVRWVRDGVVDVGAVGTVALESMVLSGRITSDDIQIVERTEPYAHWVWAARRDIDPGLRHRVREAFLSLDPAVAEHAELLRLLGASGFLPAGPRDHDSLREAAERSGYLDRPSAT